MAERSPNKPQSIEPAFMADYVRELAVEGRVGVFDVSDRIIPVYLLGQREAFRVDVAEPAFLSSQWFSAGVLTNPAAGTVLADTLALPAGTYDIVIQTKSAGLTAIDLEWRDAANAANQFAFRYDQSEPQNQKLTFAWILELNERVRVLNTIAPGAGIPLQAAIAARAR